MGRSIAAFVIGIWGFAFMKWGRQPPERPSRDEPAAATSASASPPGSADGLPIRRRLPSDPGAANGMVLMVNDAAEQLAKDAAQNDNPDLKSRAGCG